MKDYYDILELTPDASKVQIKDAFRRLAKRYHPDKNNGATEWSDFLKDVNEANQVLSDKTRKYEYDKELSQYKLSRIFNPYKYKEDEEFLIKRQEQERLYQKKKNEKTATLVGFICLLVVFMFFLFPIHDNEWELAHTNSNKQFIAEETNQVNSVEDLFGREESSGFKNTDELISPSSNTKEAKQPEPTVSKVNVVAQPVIYTNIKAEVESIKSAEAPVIIKTKTPVDIKKEPVAPAKSIAKTPKEITPVTVVKKQETITPKVIAVKVEKPVIITKPAQSKSIEWNEALMSGVLQKIEAQKLKYNNKTTCIQLAQSNTSNIVNAFSIADFLTKNGYAIAGRRIVSTKTKGAIVDARSGCVNLVIGQF